MDLQWNLFRISYTSYSTKSTIGPNFNFRSRNFSKTSGTVREPSVFSHSNTGLLKTKLDENKFIEGIQLKETPTFWTINSHYTNHQVWYPIQFKSNLSNYEIFSGDTLKLGSTELSVKKVCLNGETLESNYEILSCDDILSGGLGFYKEFPDIIKYSYKPHQFCRICYDEEEHDNPLINPCLCRGSMKYIHKNCLKLGLKSRIRKTKKGNCIFLVYEKDIRCELCSHPLSYYISFKGKESNLLVNLKSENFIWLEHFNSIGVVEACIMLFDKATSFKIGKNPYCDFVVQDPLMNDFHCCIFLENNRVNISDCRSKNGSLVKVDKELRIFIDQSISLLIGSYLLEFKAKQSKLRSFFCCGSRKKGHSHSKSVTMVSPLHDLDFNKIP